MEFMSWQNKPTNFIKTVINDTESHVKKVIAVGFQSVVVGSPVMDGAYRGNHRVTINTTDESFDKNLQDKSGTATITQGLGQSAQFKLGHTLYIQNNAPYSLRLENGWSQQAPHGVYSIAFQKMSSYK